MPHEDALRNVQLFSQFASKDLARLGRAVVERSYKKGETIVKEGEQAVAFFIIAKGKVEVIQGAGTKKAQELNTLGPSQTFGEMALLDGAPRAATVKALEDTTCLVLSRWDFVAELQTNPHMAVAMLPVLSRRLREVEARLAATF
ncbi:MAG TPA: cyclic nucleotide-binding domain-containing protein [Dehalococcoidia bacterium]|nr:cyclic nucleotide-binding domain-containing protein [Dehalococcoidia bacterium]